MFRTSSPTRETEAMNGLPPVASIEEIDAVVAGSTAPKRFLELVKANPHVPALHAMSGENGAIAALAGADLGQRIFVHINNTNPVLDPASAERKAVEAAGWHVSFDGQEIQL